MNYYDSMQSLIGSTPLVRLGNIVQEDGVNVFAKLELYNPSGSVKDRTGLYMINDAEKRGVLKVSCAFKVVGKMLKFSLNVCISVVIFSGS